MIENKRLFKYKNYLNKKIEVEIDRKLMDKHSKHHYIYPVNYGYIPNTEIEDGEEIDVYILGVFEPLEKFEGICRVIFID